MPSLKYLLPVVFLPMITTFTATVAYTHLTGKPPLLDFRSSLQSWVDGSDLPTARKKTPVIDNTINKTRTNSVLISSKQRNTVHNTQQSKRIAIDDLPAAHAHEPTSNSMTGHEAAERETDRTYPLIPLLVPPSLIAHLPQSYSRVDAKRDTRPQSTNRSPDNLNARKPLFIRESKKHQSKLASYSLETERKRDRKIDDESKPNEIATIHQETDPLPPAPTGTVQQENSAQDGKLSSEEPVSISVIPESSPKRRHTLKELRDQYLVTQEFDNSCGAAALATLMTYYFGDETSEDEILELLDEQLAGLSEEQWAKKEMNGYSLLDLKHAAEQKGYQAAGFSLTLEQLRQLAAPVIVHVRPLGDQHFAVLRGEAGNRVYLADPGRGNLTMSTQRFLNEWDGTVFVLEKDGGENIIDYPLALDRPLDYPHQRLHLLGTAGIRAMALSVDSALRSRPQ